MTKNISFRIVEHLFGLFLRVINVICQSAFRGGWLKRKDIENIFKDNGVLKKPYETSKFFNFLFHTELTNRVRLRGLANCFTSVVCPPVCDTNLMRYFPLSRVEKWIPGLSADAVSINN